MRALLGGRIEGTTSTEELTVSAWTLLTQVANAFEQLGVRDVIRIVINGEQTFVDDEERHDDLSVALRATAAAPVMRESLARMEIVFAARDEGLHRIYEVEVRNGVFTGEEEMRVDVQARPEAVRVSDGERALDYVERVRTLAGDAFLVDDARDAFVRHVQELCAAFELHMPGARVRRAPARLTLIWPGRVGIGRFRNLTWGRDRGAPRYRARPPLRGEGATAGPFFRHYVEPHWLFANFVLVDAILRGGALRHPGIIVVDPDGRALFEAHQADQFDARELDARIEAVSVDEHGVHVAADVPTSAEEG